MKNANLVQDKTIMVILWSFNSAGALSAARWTERTEKRWRSDYSRETVRIFQLADFALWNTRVTLIRLSSYYPHYDCTPKRALWHRRNVFPRICNLNLAIVTLAMFMGIRVLRNWSICYEVEVISAVRSAILKTMHEITVAIKYLLHYW